MRAFVDFLRNELSGADTHGATGGTRLTNIDVLADVAEGTLDKSSEPDLS